MKLNTPILTGLIESGQIKIIQGQVIGYASDGLAVSLGTEHDLDAVERYLIEYPTPNHW